MNWLYGRQANVEIKKHAFYYNSLVSFYGELITQVYVEVSKVIHKILESSDPRVR